MTRLRWQRYGGVFRTLGDILKSSPGYAGGTAAAAEGRQAQNAGPDLQMVTAWWWNNPQASVSDPRKEDLIYNINLRTATYVL